MTGIFKFKNNPFCMVMCFIITRHNMSIYWKKKKKKKLGWKVLKSTKFFLPISFEMIAIYKTNTMTLPTFSTNILITYVIFDCLRDTMDCNYHKICFKTPSELRVSMMLMKVCKERTFWIRTLEDVNHSAVVS